MTQRKTLWRVVWKAIVGTIGFLLAFFLVHLPHGPEHWSADLRTSWLADRLKSQHPRIVIVEVTEQTLEQLPYLSPVDRGVLASIVRALGDAEAKVIGLDFILDRKTEDEKDEDLLSAIKASSAHVVLGALNDRLDLSAAACVGPKNFESCFLHKASRPVGHLFYGEHHNPAVISDQVVREFADPAEFTELKSFAELVARAEGTHRILNTLHMSWLGHPKDGSETFLTLSGDDILSRKTNSRLPLGEMLRGKIVLVGGNFPDRDQHLTPFSVLRGERYSGIFVHAQALAQLIDLSRRPIYQLGWLSWLILVFIVAACGFLAGRSPRLASYRPWVEIAVVMAFIILSVLAFLFGRFVLPFVAMVLAWGWGEMIGHWWQQSDLRAESGGGHGPA